MSVRAVSRTDDPRRSHGALGLCRVSGPNQVVRASRSSGRGRAGCLAAHGASGRPYSTAAPHRRRGDIRRAAAVGNMLAYSRRRPGSIAFSHVADSGVMPREVRRSGVVWRQLSRIAKSPARTRITTPVKSPKNRWLARQAIKRPTAMPSRNIPSPEYRSLAAHMTQARVTRQLPQVNLGISGEGASKTLQHRRSGIRHGEGLIRGPAGPANPALPAFGVSFVL